MADSVLNSYTGDYRHRPHDIVKVRRAADGLLSISFSGATFKLFAESKTHFFAQTTDVQVDFKFDGKKKALVLSVGEGGMRCRKVE